MALKSFCDICQKEITDRDEEIRLWSNPMNSYCLGCWTDKKNWPKIHRFKNNISSKHLRILNKMNKKSRINQGKLTVKKP